ncbi:MAG TPA: prolipoprotein diacylglyceryl transferase family protein [Nitriliruptorales bacterium]
MLAVIRFPIVERIDLPGAAAISPHGIGIAVGFLLGAVLMLRRASRRGLGREYVAGLSEEIQRLLGRAMVGALLGARLFYVFRDLLTEGADSVFVEDPLAIVRVWEGGLTFLGGVAGAVLLAIPYVRSQGWNFRQVMDSATIGIVAGLMMGRLGDLFIGDHIGSPTDFVLGWRCTGNFYDKTASTFGFVDPLSYPAGAEPTTGCFDVALHQTALYDFGAALVVLLVLLWFERSPRFDGFFLAAAVFAYGTLRFLSDFARNDARIAGMTGSQLAVLGAMAAVAVWLVRKRPWEDRPWSWDLRFEHPWLSPPGDGAQAREARVEEPTNAEAD